MKYNDYKRVVIKIGSNILTNAEGQLDLNNLRNLIDQITYIHSKGVEVSVVTSASIVCGSERLGISPETIEQKQASAAVGQSILMNEYNRFFEAHGITVAQLLLTRDGMLDDNRYKNAKNTLNTLLVERVIPIINENDSVVVEEIKFGDNDNLSAVVAEAVSANALIILTDIDGLYDRDPKKNKEAKLIPEVKEISKELLDVCGDTGSWKGTGGMYSKVCAADKALKHKVEVTIANGRSENVLKKIFSGENIGTRFLVKN